MLHRTLAAVVVLGISLALTPMASAWDYVVTGDDNRYVFQETSFGKWPLLRLENGYQDQAGEICRYILKSLGGSSAAKIRNCWHDKVAPVFMNAYNEKNPDNTISLSRAREMIDGGLMAGSLIAFPPDYKVRASMANAKLKARIAELERVIATRDDTIKSQHTGLETAGHKIDALQGQVTELERWARIDRVALANRNATLRRGLARQSNAAKAQIKAANAEIQSLNRSVAILQGRLNGQHAILTKATKRSKVAEKAREDYRKATDTKLAALRGELNSIRGNVEVAQATAVAREAGLRGELMEVVTEVKLAKRDTNTIKVVPATLLTTGLKKTSGNMNNEQIIISVMFVATILLAIALVVVAIRQRKRRVTVRIPTPGEIVKEKINGEMHSFEVMYVIPEGGQVRSSKNIFVKDPDKPENEKGIRLDHYIARVKKASSQREKDEGNPSNVSDLPRSIPRMNVAK